MSVRLSEDQVEAVRRVVRWHRYETEYQQVFYLSGPAGSGKTTALTFAIDELELGGSAVAYAAYAMKAALIMRRAGLPATTIHKAIYTPIEPSREAFERARNELEELREGCPADMPAELWRRRMRDLELRLTDISSPRFALNTEAPIRDAELVVLDECSMVSQELADDILAFGVPTLIVGDPYQLPPVRGQGAFVSVTPDAMLTQIHRQALESPIIRLATMARMGEPLPWGSFGSTVTILRERNRTAADLLEADAVITGKNATRRRLNNAMKMAAGHPGPLPMGRGEKLIGQKNQHHLGLFNGQFMEIRDPSGHRDAFSFQADVVTEDGVTVEQPWIYSGYFEDHVSFIKGRKDRDFFERRGLVEADWGYCITAHKAQGSGYENVAVVDDGWGWTRELRTKWRYTAITRAADTLTILVA
jgi:exodeoxyribonuclease-5